MDTAEEKGNRQPRRVWSGDTGIARTKVAGNIIDLDKRFADVAAGMRKAPIRLKIMQDPRIRELTQQRIHLPRTPDGRQIFRIPAEIRKLIRRESRRKKEEAKKEAFARHTNWTNNGRIRKTTDP